MGEGLFIGNLDPSEVLILGMEKAAHGTDEISLTAAV